MLFTSLFFPFAVLTNEQEMYSLYPASGWVNNRVKIDLESTTYYVGYLVAVSFSILMLVNYKKRTKQLRYGKICYLIVIVTLVYMFNIVDIKSKMLIENNVENLKIVFSSSMYMLVASLPVMFLANRAIKKDEKLVKSLDRLR